VDLTKEQILAVEDLTVKKVEVPEWGGSVFVRMMTGDQRDVFEKKQTDHPGVDVRSRLFVMTVSDESGHLLYTEDDMPAIKGKAGAAIDRVFAAAAKHNRITPEDIAELKAAS